MTGIFKQKSPANIIVLLVFGVLIKLPIFLYPHVPQPKTTDGALFTWLLGFLGPTGKSFPLIYPILTYAIIYLQAISLTTFINNQRMMSRPNYFPGMAYMLITSLFPEWNLFSAPLLVNGILVLVLSRLFKTYNQQAALGTVFNIGLALGIASFIFFPAVTFIIWILLALAVMRAVGSTRRPTAGFPDRATETRYHRRLPAKARTATVMTRPITARRTMCESTGRHYPQ